MNRKIETAIIDLLKAQEPATLEQICWELRTQQGLRTAEVLPIAITAISTMQENGLICEYEQMPFTDPMEYAWVLAEEQPKPEPITCPYCRGTGRDPMSDIVNWFRCEPCHGKGTR